MGSRVDALAVTLGLALIVVAAAMVATPLGVAAAGVALVALGSDVKRR